MTDTINHGFKFRAVGKVVGSSEFQYGGGKTAHKMHIEVDDAKHEIAFFGRDIADAQCIANGSVVELRGVVTARYNKGFYNPGFQDIEIKVLAQPPEGEEQQTKPDTTEQGGDDDGGGGF